LQERVHHI